MLKECEIIMLGIDDSPMTKEKFATMYNKWLNREDDMEPIYSQNQYDISKNSSTNNSGTKNIVCDE